MIEIGGLIFDRFNHRLFGRADGYADFMAAFGELDQKTLAEAIMC